MKLVRTPNNNVQNRVLIRVNEYPKFVEVLFPELTTRYGHDVFPSDEIVKVFKELYGFNVKIVPYSPLWHIHFTKRSATHFFMMYS